MDIKISVELLDEQIRLLDTYASIITNGHYKDLVDGIINLLDRISFAVENGETVTFSKCDEV